MRLQPFELTQRESGVQVRYRYDWHIGAIPERYTYDKTGQKLPLLELALDLSPAIMGGPSAMGGSGTGIPGSGIMRWIF